METPSLNQDDRKSFLTQTNNTDIAISLPKISKNGNDIALPTVNQRGYTNEDFKSPLEIKNKRFHFNISTTASEFKGKFGLQKRIPEFILNHNTTLISNRKFILPDKSRSRTLRATGKSSPVKRTRRTTYSSAIDESQESKKPKLVKVIPRKESNQATAIQPQRKANSFAGFGINTDNNKTNKTRRKKSNERNNKTRSVSEGAETTFLLEERDQSYHGDRENTCLMEVDTSRVDNDNVLYVQINRQLSKRRPIERFRKSVRILCFLLMIKNSIDRKYKQQQHSVVFEQLEELSETVVCNDDGMVFDPNYFKAVKEIKLSQEAVQILSMEPGTRTEEQLQAALAGLKASVSAFGEYPLKMQRRLVTVGWYESFEAKRVIIRQGHRAENFYFILSGTALVTLLVNDSTTGEQRSTTVAVLGKGSSFGELALLHHKTRSATVLCRNDVALLAVGREDFRDIFMSYEDGKEAEHIRFLRTISYMQDLPLDQCSTRPDVCIFHYFRRGVVIVKNSQAEWIYILKSGSCRVLTNLVKRKTTLPTTVGRPNTSIVNLPSIPVDEFERRKLLYTASGERMDRKSAWSTERPRTEPNTKKEREALALPLILTPDQKFKKTVKKVNFALPWIERLNEKHAQEQLNAHRERIETLHKQLTSTSMKKRSSNLEQDKNNNKNNNKEKYEHVCVQIEVLKPKDQFGLASILYDDQAVKCHLVSNGAECILIQKSWFLQNASEAFLRELRAQTPPYPTQETLEQKIQDQANWESFKNQTINDLLDTLHL